MSKRQKFLAISFILATTLGLICRLDSVLVLIGGLFLSLVAVFLTYLALRKELNGLEYLTLLIPPFLLTLGYILIFYFFPNFNVFFTLVILASYFISFYSLILTCNIFSAAAVKNLLLLKPAQTTFLFVMITVFFLLNTHISKLGIFFVFQILFTFLLMWFLSFLVFWTHTLNKTAQFNLKQAKQWALLVAVTTFLATWWLAFLKFEPFFRSLVLSSSFNASLGIFIAKQTRQINKKAIFEYMLIPLLALGFSIVVG